MYLWGNFNTSTPSTNIIWRAGSFARAQAQEYMYIYQNIYCSGYQATEISKATATTTNVS